MLCLVVAYERLIEILHQFNKLGFEEYFFVGSLGKEELKITIRFCLLKKRV